MAKNIGRISLTIAGSLLLLALTLVLSQPLSSTKARSLSAASPRDVVINEIAWMGTTASSADEWIELYNTTASPVDLTGWTLSAADGIPDITLNGSIPAHGYFLLERTDDTTVNDIPADQIYTGALGNTGENLTLSDDASQIIDTANANGGTWPAGDNDTKSTLERITPLAADSDANWATNDGVTRNGQDAGGDPLNGTPKAQNSQYQSSSPAADLSVAKTGPLTTTAGSLITYHLTLSNTGDITATATWLTDTLPAGVTFLSSTPAPSTQAGQRLVWQLGDVPTTALRLITVTAQVSETATGPFANHITATTTATETATGNNVAAWTTTLGAPPTARVLINAVLYDGYQDGDTDEAIQLLNAGDATADLTGWELCKYATGYSCRALPLSSLAPHERVWLARNTVAFSASFGFPPDYEPVSWLSSGLANGGDEVILRDETHAVMDAVVFEGGTATIPGWSGESVQPYDVGRAEGQILYRIPDETSGRPIPDTDTASDWIQNTGDTLHGRRVLYPGWDLDPLFWPLQVTETATVVIGIAPDNAFDVISATLLRAQHTISIETYSLRHPAIIMALVTKAQAGVNVTVLLEGSQVGVGELDPRWQQELWACQQLEAAGGRCYFMIHDDANHIFNRYNYLHAKLLIVDDEWVAVSSQNFTNSSMPADDKSNGTYGSRGTVIAATAPSVVARAAEIFALDCDAAHHNDILRWNTGSDSKYGPPSPGFTPNLTIPDGITNTVYFSQPLVVSGTFGFELFTAPEAALRQSDALLGLLARAGDGDRVSVEQLYEYPDWGDNPTSDPNLRLEAYIAAARRGAEVRIVLNSGHFGQEYYADTYTQTVAYVNQLARDEGLNLQASGGDPTQYGIHNKMVLVWLADAGGYVHIGSINGSESSSKVNREVALQIHSDAVYDHLGVYDCLKIYDYLERIFMVDWWLSNPSYLPLVMRNYVPPQNMLISEVYYGSGSPNGEWIELYNPTGHTFDLSGYKIGDAETPERYEGMFQFPPNTTLASHGVLVIAYDGSQTPQADFEMYDYNAAIPQMLKYQSWGTGDWTLRNLGDQVLLLGPHDEIIDAVVWGDATYVGLIPHPGLSIPSHSLQRFPPDVDTDDCSVDFREFPISPGEVLFP